MDGSAKEIGPALDNISNNESLARSALDVETGSTHLPSPRAPQNADLDSPEKTPLLVEFDGPNDLLNPQNWSVEKKLCVFILVSLATVVVTLTSSIFSTVIAPLVATYGTSREVGTLGVSLYVLGFATGPLIWAPFSELKGRRIPFLTSMFCFSIFSFATAVSKDLQSIFICRFFAGFFGACTLTLAGAIASDMFSPDIFLISMVCFVLTVFSGPLLAPLIGGFIVMNENLGWRWTHYIPGILGSASFLALFFYQDETYAPVILVAKARKLRHETKNWAIHAKHEEIELDIHSILHDYLAIPLKMLALDPIILFMCTFGAFVYGLLYLFLTAYPFIFQRVHGMNAGVSGLPFLGVIIGQFIAGLVMYLRQPGLRRMIMKNNGQIIPEWFIIPAIPGAVAFSAGLFWLGWTGYKRDIHWIVPTLSGLLTGYGLISIFISSIQYVVQYRRQRAASAIAAHTFLRSLAGAVFPLFATYMFDGLGVEWGLTLLGCVAAALIPIPIILYIYGARIRAKSKLVL
ncbi:major facilitator superfamily domain-containing protein [Aspergillus granulosus]|uniref:Major facilitator superfamily domain-containing protein n=1 Tax=Aspergillus granulosus TaxID=176169 RepID=A0ABR4H1G6_9EURO